LRAELTEQGRQEIGTSESHIEVGARDPSDADALIAALREKALIRDAVVKPLGRYRRWRVRQQLLGNYGGVSDPTQPS
jgi:hypothetical protein